MFMGKAQWKHVSVKKLSVKKRSVKKRSVKNGSVFAESGLKVKRTVEGGFTSVDVSGDVCPFDKKPCMYGKEFISSCDDVSSVIMGFDIREGEPCSRSVGKSFKVSKK
jgi:hypothetical protein